MQTTAVHDGLLTEVRRAASGLAAGDRSALRLDLARLLPAVLTAIAFVALFARPMTLLVRDWWTIPEAGHGLLLAPVAIWLAWKSGIRRDAVGNPAAGIALLVMAVVIRYAAGLAAELFTMRASIVMALAGITVYHYGLRQLLHWWLPFLLGSLSIPLPELVTQALALPLQFKASQMGAALLRGRGIPVLLTGNVIRLPGHELFVTEACSGLRSLTALISLGVLLAGITLRTPIGRALLIAVAIPIAILVNGVRVFLTGFLVYFVDPALGQGFMHLTEGWLLFIASFSLLCGIAWVAAITERRIIDGPRAPAVPAEDEGPLADDVSDAAALEMDPEYETAYHA